MEFYVLYVCDYNLGTICFDNFVNELRGMSILE